MFKKNLTKPDIFLITANIVPVIGAWFFNWDPQQIFMVYALETVIIGIFTLLKMGIVTMVKKTDTWYNEGSSTQKSGIFFMLFFLVRLGQLVGEVADYGQEESSQH